MNKQIACLKEMSKDLAHVAYEDIYDEIGKIDHLAVPEARLFRGWPIDRVRVNDPADVHFNTIKEVSCITDPDILPHVEMGRANNAGQGIFYGAVMSPEIRQPRLTAYMETSRIQRYIALDPDTPAFQDITETFTMSRWRIREHIQVLELFYNEEALKASSYARDSLQKQLKRMQGIASREDAIEQLQFFSGEFARNDVEKGENFKYKISAAYTNFILAHTKLQGVTYPSVATGYQGQNVALTAKTVDQALKLESAAIFKFERIKGENIPIDAFRMTEGLGPKAMAFRWADYPGDFKYKW